MRALIYLALFAAFVAAVIWGMQRFAELRSPNRLAPAPAPTPLPTGDHRERATLAYGPDAGGGDLVLTPSQLVFRADSGRVLVVERFDVAGVNVSTELPDRTLTRPVLVVSAGGEVYYFAVTSPTDWVRRLLT